MRNVRWIVGLGIFLLAGWWVMAQQPMPVSEASEGPWRVVTGGYLTVVYNQQTGIVYEIVTSNLGNPTQCASTGSERCLRHVPILETGLPAQ